MFKKLAVSAIASTLLLANLPSLAQTSQSERWVTIGKTNTGETLSLDLSSAQFTGYGEATLFTYKFTGNVSSRVNKAVTESCEGVTGKLRTDSSLEWFVNSQNGKETQIVVKAESQASKLMLGRVCYQALVMFQRYGIQN